MRVSKHELEEIYFLEQELQMWVRKKCEVDYGIGSVGVGKNGRSSSGKNPAEELVARRLEISEHIESILGQIQDKRVKVLQIIEKIDDSLLRMIINYRCIELNNWQQVSVKMKYGTADSVRMVYNRAFENGFLKDEYIKK